MKECGHEIEDYKLINHKNKEFRIYIWNNKPFNDFEIPKEFRLARVSEVHILIEEKKIEYSGKWEVFFCDNVIKGLSRLGLGGNGLDSGSDYLADSYSDGRVVVVRELSKK